MALKKARRIYKVIFQSQGQVVEIYARQVSQGSIFGFVEIEGLLFGERTKVVVDPGEERLKQEFDGVKRFHVPLHAVLRIDEVEREGRGRMVKGDGSSVMPFPMPLPDRSKA